MHYLWDNGHGTAQRLEPKRGGLHAVDEDGAGRGLHQTKESEH